MEQEDIQIRSLNQVSMKQTVARYTKKILFRFASKKCDTKKLRKIQRYVNRKVRKELCVLGFKVSAEPRWSKDDIVSDWKINVDGYGVYDPEFPHLLKSAKESGRKLSVVVDKGNNCIHYRYNGIGNPEELLPYSRASALKCVDRWVKGENLTERDVKRITESAGKQNESEDKDIEEKLAKNPRCWTESFEDARKRGAVVKINKESLMADIDEFAKSMKEKIDMMVRKEYSVERIANYEKNEKADQELFKLWNNLAGTERKGKNNDTNEKH